MLIPILWLLVYWTPALFFFYAHSRLAVKTKLKPAMLGVSIATAATGLAQLFFNFPASNHIVWRSPLFAMILAIGMIALAVYLDRDYASQYQKIEDELAAAQAQKQQDMAEQQTKEQQAQISQKNNLLIDISALVYGNVALLVTSTFPQANILIPRFLLNAITNLANASEQLPSAQGQYARQMLEQIQASPDLKHEIIENEYPGAPDYEAKLAQVLAETTARLITADQKIAAAIKSQGHQVVLLTQIKSALADVHFVGQIITCRLTEPGQEANQAICYLPDGTKIVVDGGGSHLSTQTNVKIQRLYQTVAGKIIFATLE